MKSRNLITSCCALFFTAALMMNPAGCGKDKADIQDTGGVESGTGGGNIGGQSGSGGVTAGTGGSTATGGTGGIITTGGTGGVQEVIDSGAGTGDTGGTTGTEVDAGGTGGASSQVLPTPSDYAAPGPFDDAMMVSNTGPNNAYTLFRPGASLGKDGFMHPIVTWGNGIMTTPDAYKTTLTLIATHGFVIIASNDTKVEEPALSAGLDWLIQQNTSSGEMQGKLDTSLEATVGYSWGGGAAIDAANRPNVRCTVSLHGMPPRRTDAFATMHSPLLLFTSTGDSFVTADQYVTPNYEQSTVQTFYATLDDATAGHLYVADEGGISCLVSAALGTCQSAKEERAPVIAWLRLWIYGEQDARKFFYGDDCILCQSPWTNPQRKNWN